jgi:L-alanine-DL-glutamate epimerase-like enolase superfamily enzyme
MRIRRVWGDLYRVPVYREMHDAIRHFSKMDIIFAHVKTEEGAVGSGFSYSIIPFGAREICSIINCGLDQLIRDVDPRDHERIWSRMWRQVDWVGRGGIAVLAIAAVDIAI